MLVTIHEFAEAEINEARLYYDLLSPGLGVLFIDEIEKALTHISDFPNAAPLVRGKIRKKIVPCFPYALLYSVKVDQISFHPETVLFPFGGVNLHNYLSTY